MSDLYDAIVKTAAMDPSKPMPIWAQRAGVEAARRVANLDLEAAASVLEGAYDVPPVTAKIMAQYTVFAALGITTKDTE